MVNHLKIYYNPPAESLKQWRKGSRRFRHVTDPDKTRRRFRHVADFEKRYIQRNRLSKIQEDQDLKVTFLGTRAMHFMDAAGKHHHPWDAKASEFRQNPAELAYMVRNHDLKTLLSLQGVDGVAEVVDVSVDEGVKSSDVSNRQKTYGVNTYSEKPSKSFLMFVRTTLHDLTLFTIIVCAMVLIGWADGVYDGLAILLSIIFVVIITAVCDYKQFLQFRDYDNGKKNISSHVTTTRDGFRQKVSIYELVVGDVVHLSIGDKVPADGILISGYNLLIDESSLKGESDPVHIHEKKPFLHAGTKVQDGSAKMLVTAVGMNTEWGQLMETLREGGYKTTTQVKANGVATIIGRYGLVFSVLTFLVLTVRFVAEKAMRNEFTTWSSTDALSMVSYFAIAVTIIAVTVMVGLPMAVKLSLAFSMKNKVLVGNLSGFEAMGFCTCICTEKTGILTADHMIVDKISVSGETIDVRDSEGRVLSPRLSESVLTVLLQGIFACTGSVVVKDITGKTSILGSPTESTIGGDFETALREIRMLKIMEPFNSAKKKMSVIVSLPEGQTRAFCKGASEIVLGLCDKLIDGNGEVVALNEEKVKFITNVIEEFAVEALRTLCLAYLDVEGSFDCDKSLPENGYTLIAVVGLKNPLRPGVEEAVEACLAAGITVRMVTGYSINTAKAIAKECGILTEGGIAIEGQDFRSKTTEELNEIAPKIQVMARSSLTDKHELIEHLERMSEVVAVVSNGTDHVPALHESDTGFAMGIAGTQVAKEQADVIVMDDDFATIVKVAKWGRAVYINIQKFVQFYLTVNIVALIFNFVSACITAVQLLWVNLIMVTLGALALATEPPNDGLMKRPPVKRTDSFITKTMWRNILGQSVYQMAVLFVLNFAGKPILNLHGPNSTATLNTFIFNTFVFCQVFNEINSRDMEKINIFRGMFSSWVFMGVMIATVVFQVIIVEFLGTFASTVPLDWQLWGLSIVIGLVSIPIAVVLKCIPVEKTAVKEQHDGYEILPDGPDRV